MFCECICFVSRFVHSTLIHTINRNLVLVCYLFQIFYINGLESSEICVQRNVHWWQNWMKYAHQFTPTTTIYHVQRFNRVRFFVIYFNLKMNIRVRCVGTYEVLKRFPNILNSLTWISCEKTWNIGKWSNNIRTMQKVETCLKIKYSCSTSGF